MAYNLIELVNSSDDKEGYFPISKTSFGNWLVTENLMDGFLDFPDVYIQTKQFYVYFGEIDHENSFRYGDIILEEDGFYILSQLKSKFDDHDRLDPPKGKIYTCDITSYIEL